MKRYNPSTAAKLRNATLPVSQNFPKLPVSGDVSFSGKPKNEPNPFLEQVLKRFDEQTAATSSCKAEEQAQEAHPEQPLTERQLLALQLLLKGQSDTDVARQIGVDRRTLYNWRQSPDFALELQAQTEAIRTAVSSRLTALLSNVSDVLESILAKPDDPRTALAAASLVLRTALKEVRPRY